MGSNVSCYIHDKGVSISGFYTSTHLITFVGSVCDASLLIITKHAPIAPTMVLPLLWIIMMMVMMMTLSLRLSLFP